MITPRLTKARAGGTLGSARRAATALLFPGGEHSGKRR
jgi:hypothetical protein